ncbi:hypothetical protein [Carboxylicivirga marina]|uniref:Tetratricopeptide repeat protein n=1 Tax=Carboxylicivirga marina TaxID=2800988 RepID=A0ABS1HQW7_9BACT|nr:hypothetical protein [Carboxylicivirga marina]MBK3519986.1 hypothetical protein [Carboxylicivirga marina]
MKELLELEKSYDELPEESEPETIIKFFEDNSDVFLSNENMDVSDVLHIYTDYLYFLGIKSRYSKVIAVTEEMEKRDYIKHQLENDKDFNMDFVFYKSASLSRRKRYKEALKGFKQLILIDPQNEDYKDWYIETKRNILHILLNYLMFGSIGLALLAIIMPIYFSISVPKGVIHVFEGIFFSILAFKIIENLVRKK